jgi:septal ring-binding cell division protein DamX
MPQTSQGLDDDRTGIAAVTSLPAQVAPPGGEIEVALGVEVAVQPVPVAESSAGSGRPAPAPSSDETLVSPPETTPTATANEGVSSKRAQPRYSIQLISLRETASLEQFARDEGLIGKALRLESDAAAAQRWHPVLLGAYPNRPAADAVLDALPARLRRLSPFVRALGAGEHLVPIGGR